MHLLILKLPNNDALTEETLCSEIKSSHLKIRQAELYLPVQPARPHQCWVQSVRSVCGHQHFDVAPGVKPIQLVDELQHGALHLIVTSSPIIKTSTWRGDTGVSQSKRQVPGHGDRVVTVAATKDTWGNDSEVHTSICGEFKRCDELQSSLLQKGLHFPLPNWPSCWSLPM